MAVFFIFRVWNLSWSGLMCSPGWPGTHRDPPAPAFWVVRLKVCAMTPGFHLFTCVCMFVCARAEVEKQFSGHFSPSTVGSGDRTLVILAWRQAPLPVEPSYQPSSSFIETVLLSAWLTCNTQSSWLSLPNAGLTTAANATTTTPSLCSVR